MNILTRQQKLLLEFVKKQHGEQKRKYTGEPYWTHPLEVATILHDNGLFNMVELALCHDLYEDTKCNFDSLYKELLRLDYSNVNAYNICKQVQELTDVFTHEDYPYMNRLKRKQKEAKRLGNVSFKAQTVKYADLISNTKSIVENDPKFAVVYLKEKQEILNRMTDGDATLFQKCFKQLKNKSIFPLSI